MATDLKKYFKSQNSTIEKMLAGRGIDYTMKHCAEMANSFGRKTQIGSDAEAEIASIKEDWWLAKSAEVMGLKESPSTVEAEKEETFDEHMDKFYTDQVAILKKKKETYGLDHAIDYCVRSAEDAKIRAEDCRAKFKTLYQTKSEWFSRRATVLKLGRPKPEVKDAINPSHYKQYPIEVIDMMIAIFGKEATASYCVMTAYKYRMRLGHKDNVEQELKKESWYLSKAAELRGKS